MTTTKQLLFLPLSLLSAVLLLSCGGEGSADDRYEAGLALFEQGQWEEAIVEFEAAGEAFETNAGYRRISGDFEEAKQITAQHLDALLKISQARTELGQDRLALAALSSAVHVDPKSATAFASRAIVHTRLGMDGEAEEDVAKAEELGYDSAQLKRDIEAAKNAR